MSTANLLCMTMRFGGIVLSEFAQAVLEAKARECMAAGSPAALALGDCPL